MISQKLVDKLESNGCFEYDDVLFIDEEALVDSLVGISQDGRAVYDYYSIAHDLMRFYSMSLEDAMAHIDCNIIRSLPYYGSKAPVIIDLME